MATYTNIQHARLDALYKKAVGKAFGSVNIIPPSETLASDLGVNAKRISLTVIPSEPPATSTDSIKKWYPEAAGGVGWLVFSRDLSVADGSKWVALPEHNPSFSGGSASQATKDSILKGWIMSSSGPLYLPKFYDGNDEWIPGASDALPTLDPDAGVLTFAQPRAESGATPAESIKMTAFQDVGQTLAEYVAQAGDSSLFNAYEAYINERDKS